MSIGCVSMCRNMPMTKTGREGEGKLYNPTYHPSKAKNRISLVFHLTQSLYIMIHRHS